MSNEVDPKYYGPLWLMTFDKLTFDVPFIGNRVELGLWFTMSTTYLSAIFYVFLVYFVFPRIKPSNRKFMDRLSLVHNVALCIYSGIACFGTVYLLWSRGEFSDFDGFLCNEVPDWYRFLSITFTLSKYWEWFDTALLVWYNRPIGFLHFYHHMTTVFLFMHTMNHPGTEKIGLLLNGFVHLIMYYHFAFRLPKFLRPVITIAQIIQLAIGTSLQHVNISRCSQFEGYIDNYFYSYLCPYFFVPVYLFFFLKFFKDTYLSSKPSSSPSSTKDAIAKKTD